MITAGSVHAGGARGSALSVGGPVRRPLAPAWRAVSHGGVSPRHVVFCTVFLAACGGPVLREGPLYAGRTGGAPGIECLPDPDVTDESLTEHMRFGRRLATDALEIEDPVPPVDHSATSLTEWSAGPLREWLEQKSHAVEEARHELDLAAEENHRQRIMAGAIVGLLYESVARVLGDVPAPDDLRDEPEILEIYRSTVAGEASPFLETSRRGYHACERNATEPASMSHWAAFCSARLEMLPAPLDGTGDDVTEVDIVAE